MDKKPEEVAAARISLISSLIAAGKIDTVYRDVYLERARRIIEEFFPHADYLQEQHSKAELWSSSGKTSIKAHSETLAGQVPYGSGINERLDHEKIQGFFERRRNTRRTGMAAYAIRDTDFR